jgi:glucosamine--fructose-6-phosphate aminotransferase (isomerizing)
MTTARYLVPRLGEAAAQTLVVGISSSGEVARTLEAVEAAREAGASTVALTTREGSSLARAADASIVLPTPDAVAGPGLVTYLASLLMGYALAAALAEPGPAREIDQAIRALPGSLGKWVMEEAGRGRDFAAQFVSSEPIVFLGSGPAYGAALFAAAKQVEAAGIPSWAQDLEEWAHVEYFAEPAEMGTWILSAAGRARTRETEVEAAAQAIGRRLGVSRWEPGDGHLGPMREGLAPLALWAGPWACAGALMESLGEQPFRVFGGGRSPSDGGGPNRVRSSVRLTIAEQARSAERP